MVRNFNGTGIKYSSPKSKQVTEEGTARKIKDVEESANAKCLRYSFNNRCEDCPGWVREEMNCDKLKGDKQMKKLPEDVKEALKNGELEVLTERKRTILEDIYFAGLKGVEVADKLGISNRYVSTLKNQAIEEAKEELRGGQTEEVEQGEAEQEDVKQDQEEQQEVGREDMLMFLVDGNRPVRVHPDSDVEELKQVLEEYEIEAEVYERVS